MLEFKSTTGQRSAAIKTLCAMSNNKGGTVLFGVDPGGKLVGQQVGRRTIEEISEEIRHIDPSVYPSIEQLPLAEDREIVVVSVDRGHMRPYTYRERPYTRVGNATERMTLAASNQMLFERMHSDQRWENQPAPGWSIDDLDMTLVKSVVAEAVRRNRLNDPGGQSGPEDLLRGFGVIRDGELLRAGVVLFGKPDRFASEMPQCLLRVAHFRGIDRKEFLDNRQFHGNAFTVLRQAQHFLASTLPIAGRFEEGKLERIDTPLYPTDATREALANAICHRDYAIGGGSVSVAVYDDRLEVSSTGTLPFGLTPEQLFEPHNSAPWNPIIANAFYLRGIIERWGRGIPLMAEQVVAAGLPRLEIEDDRLFVTVRFRNNRNIRSPSGEETGSGMPQDVVVRQLARVGHPVTLGKLLSSLGDQLSDRQLKRTLAYLRSQGVVDLTGRGRGAKWSLKGKGE